MKRPVCLLVLIAMSLTAQQEQQKKRPGDPDEPLRLPNGKLQQEELLMEYLI